MLTEFDLYTISFMIAIISTVVLFQLSVLFYFQYKKIKEFLSFILLLCFSAFFISSIFYFLRIFISAEPIYYRLEVMFRFLAFSTFVYIYEFKINKMKVPFVFIYCMISIVAIMVLPYSIAYDAGFTIYLPAMYQFLFFYRALKKTDGQIKRMFIITLSGAFVMGIGIGLSAEKMVEFLGFIFLPIGLLIQLIGLAMIGLSFYQIRSVNEIIWETEPISVFIILNGLCLFSYSFKEKEDVENADLFGGGLAASLLVAKNIVKSDQPPAHIEFQNLHFLISIGLIDSQGSKPVAVMLVKKNLLILQDKLKKFMNLFETQFKSRLISWNGQVFPKEEYDSIMNVFAVKMQQGGAK